MITRVHIAGMTSPRAVQAVFTALTPVEGIVNADVRLGAAVIEHDGRATGARIREALAATGLEITELVEERRRLSVMPADDDAAGGAR